MDLNWHPFKLKFPAKLVLTLEIVRRNLELGYIDNICITGNRMVAKSTDLRVMSHFQLNSPNNG